MDENVGTSFDAMLLLEKTKLLKTVFDSQLSEMNSKISSQIADIHSHIETKLPAPDLTKENEKRPGNLTRKIFVHRPSLLTELFELSHIRTIRHVFISVMIVFALHAIFEDISNGFSNPLSLEVMFQCFGKFSIAITTVIQMQLSAMVLLYLGFHYWADFRYKWDDDSHKKYYDGFFIFVFLLYLSLFVYLPSYIVISEQLPIATSLMVLLEQNFFCITKKEILGETNKLPDFSKYLYFLFCPTLIYRDEYPRTREIRWNFVFENFAQVALTILYSYYVFLRVSVPQFSSIATDTVTLKSFIFSVFSCIFPGSMLLLLVFYGFLHCWLNAFAEMLRFADRMFYKDWWNSTSYMSYYRTWNTVVHDWLHNYIYLDCLNIIGKQRKKLAVFVVLLVSAIVHEYVFTLMLGFFYPVNFVLFLGLGTLFTLVPLKRSKSSVGNVFFWVSMLIGLGTNVSLYSMEWYARKNCPPYINLLVDRLFPRSFTCILGKHAAKDQTLYEKQEL